MEENRFLPPAGANFVIAKVTKEGAEVKPRAPTDLLEEMLEIQEALEDAKTAGLDDTSRARLADERRRLMERREALEGLLIGAFPEWDGTLDAGKDRQPVLERFKLALAERAYLTTVIDDLNDALGESEEGHVSHRRH